MRTKPLVVFALFIALICSLGLPAHAANPQLVGSVGPGDVFLALGDSLATGTEAEINNDALPGYPTDLLAHLRTLKPELELNNLAVALGETSSSFIADGQLARAIEFIERERAAGRVVSPVTLTIGGNDMAALLQPGSTGTVSATLATYQANLETILDQLIAALTNDEGQRTGDLIIANLYNPYPGLSEASPLPLSVNPDRDIPMVDEVTRALASARGIAVADLQSAFRGREAELTYVRFPYVFFPLDLERNFDFHPRPAGHRVIAESFAQAGGYLQRQQRIYLPLVVR